MPIHLVLLDVALPASAAPAVVRGKKEILRRQLIVPLMQLGKGQEDVHGLLRAHAGGNGAQPHIG